MDSYGIRGMRERVINGVSERGGYIGGEVLRMRMSMGENGCVLVVCVEKE